MNDPHHPIWRFLQTCVYLLFACFFLWLNASHFDTTEIKTLIELAAVMLGAEAIKAKVAKQ